LPSKTSCALGKPSQHQAYHHLFAVGTLIAGIAALRLRVGRRPAREIGARDVVEQHFVLARKKLSTASGQMRFENALVHEQMIETAIEAILVDLLISELQQIGQRRAPNQIRPVACGKYPRLALHAQICSPQPLNSLIHQSRRDKLTREFDPQLRKLG